MIAISILGIKDDNDKIIEVDKLKTDYIHLDILDGKIKDNDKVKIDYKNDEIVINKIK